MLTERWRVYDGGETRIEGAASKKDRKILRSQADEAFLGNCRDKRGRRGGLAGSGAGSSHAGAKARTTEAVRDQVGGERAGRSQAAGGIFAESAGRFSRQRVC